MSFAAADIPAQMPDTFIGVFEQIRDLERHGGGFSPEQLAALMSGADRAVAMSLQALDEILDYDLEWRTSVFEGRTEFDQAIQDRLEAYLGLWVESLEAPLSILEGLKPMGFDPPGLETLRARLAEVRSMLTPDEEFFRGEKLDELAKAAVDEDEAGHTVPFEVMGE